MKSVNNFFKGIDFFFKGLNFLFAKGLWYYMLYPFLLWIAFMVAAHYLVGGLIDQFTGWLEKWLRNFVENGFLHSISDKISFLVGAITFLTSVLLKLAFWFVSGTLVKYLTLIFLSPMLSRLSEVCESRITGEKFGFSFRQFLKDVVRGILISVRNMFFEYLFMIAGFILCFFFPPLVFVVTPLLFFVSCYYYGFTMMDYSCERHRMNMVKSVRFVHKNKALVCGVGCCLALCFKIPTIFGDLVALIIGPASAVIGATLAWHQVRKEESEPVQIIHS